MASPVRPHRPLGPFERQAVVARAIARREAGEQARALLRELPRCPHGEPVRLCPLCNQSPIEEVPF